MTRLKLMAFRSLAVSLLLMFIVSLKAQETDTLQNLPNLLFPKFAKGIVKLKDGKIYTATLNYETVEQEMVFLQKKLTIILDKPQLIDTIFLNNKIFVPFEKGFFEVVVKAPISLFIQHKSYVESPGMPIGYGAMSQTTAPNYVRQVFAGNGSIGLKLPDNYKVVDDSENWIRWANGMERFSTKNQFLKIFPDKQKELKQFISKNQIDLKNNFDLTKLMLYTNEIYGK
jgi:hypothetical protein